MSVLHLFKRRLQIFVTNKSLSECTMYFSWISSLLRVVTVTSTSQPSRFIKLAYIMLNAWTTVSSIIHIVWSFKTFVRRTFIPQPVMHSTTAPLRSCKPCLLPVLSLNSADGATEQWGQRLTVSWSSSIAQFVVVHSNSLLLWEIDSNVNLHNIQHLKHDSSKFETLFPAFRAS